MDDFWAQLTELWFIRQKQSVYRNHEGSVFLGKDAEIAAERKV